MERLTLERRQVWIYLAAIGAGLPAGSAAPALGPVFETMLWPALALLLYVTFVPVPVLHLREAVRDRRFVGAVLGGNFVLLPLMVWGLLAWLPPDPVLRVGVLLVLLAPCTDWFITFSALGGGDAPRAIAVTPVNLIAQLLLLPLYPWLMAAPDLKAALMPADLAPAVAVVLVPLAAAALTQLWVEAKRHRAVWRERLAWWPVPLLAVVVFLIAGAQIGAVRAALGLLPLVVPVFIAFLVAAALIAKALAVAVELPARQGRTLGYSLGTRNSFVVLPFALALPAGWEPAAVVIVTQSLVELFGMMFYLWWLPGRLFR